MKNKKLHTSIGGYRHHTGNNNAGPSNGGLNRRQHHTHNQKLDALLERLASDEGVIRLQARNSLAALGNLAVTPLVRALRHATADQVRWEAAKLLGTLSDAKAIPVLVHALEDRNHDVAWLAAEALQKYAQTAWPTLLRKLVKRGADSLLLRQGAHHVLQQQQAEGCNDLLAPLNEVLASATGAGSVMVAADNLLQRLAGQAGSGTPAAGPMQSWEPRQMNHLPGTIPALWSKGYGGVCP